MPLSVNPPKIALPKIVMPTALAPGQLQARTQRATLVIMPMYRTIPIFGRLLVISTLAVAVLATSRADRPFQTTPSMSRETRMVIDFLEHQHYLKQSLRDVDMAALIEAYAEELDGTRMFFLNPEVQEYVDYYSPKLYTYLNRGNLLPAFAIFDDYRNQALKRLDWVLKRIDQEFDFTNAETYIVDRDVAKWPATVEQADQLWEQRLEYQLLNELLALADEEAKVLAEFNSDIESSEADTASETADMLSEGANTASENAESDVVTDSTELASASESEPKVAQSFEAQMEAARDTIRKRYTYIRDSLLELEAQDVQEIFLSTLTQRYDPHSTYMSAATMEEFQIAMKNSLVGIGAVLTEKDGYCEISELITGGPAYKSGELGAGDRIVGVAQGEDGDMVDVVGKKLKKVVQLIRGEKNTMVRLLVQPAGSDPSQRVIIDLVRDKIKLTAKLATAEIYEVPQGESVVNIGVINLPAFYGSDADIGKSSTTDDVRELLVKLEAANVDGIILDLRRNGGGLLSEAIDLTGLFIPYGPVVQVRDFVGKVEQYADTDRSVSWSGPLVVLVSKYSASASEITAGALKNYRRAIIVGDAETHGKGTVQAVFNLSRSSFLASLVAKRGAAKVTVQKFYLPDGSSTQIKGVTSDITLPSFNAYLPISEADLDNPLPWDTIAPAKQFKLDRDLMVADGLIESLRQSSFDRQLKLEEFAYLNDRIDSFREQYEQKAFSLSLAERQAQRERERDYDNALDDRFESLLSQRYDSEPVLLNLRLEADAELPDEPDDADDAEATERKDKHRYRKNPDAFDIQLRESLRIMADWIHLERSDGELTHISADYETTDKS